MSDNDPRVEEVRSERELYELFLRREDDPRAWLEWRQDSLIAENARLANVIQQVRELAQSAKADRDGSLLAAATDFHGRPFPVYVDAESILRILDQEQTFTTSELENR